MAIKIIAVVASILIFLLATCFLGYSIMRFAYPLKYKEYVFYYADKYDVERALVFSVIRTESGFNEKAQSEKGAKGLMQITEKTARYIASLLNETEYDLFEPKTNIRFGVYYLKYLSEKFSDINSMLCAYNAGEGKTKEWLNQKEYSTDGISLEKIPYAETSAYVKKTYKSFIKYQKLYGDILDKCK